MTVSTAGFASLLSSSLVFAVCFAAIRLWRHRVPGLKGRDSVRAATYLARYSASLEYYGLRRREIMAHTNALRSDLAAAAEAGNPTSLDGLGPPRALAAEVAGHLLRPSWLRGTIWAGLAVVASLLLSLLLAEAFLGGFEPAAAPAEAGEWSGLGFTIEATMGDDGRASSIGFGGMWPIVAPVLAFVIGARAWRLLNRNHSKHPAEIAGLQ